MGEKKNKTTIYRPLQRQFWVSAAFLLIFSSILSKVIGFFREILIAKNFGISNEIDAYFVCISVPVLIGGTFGSSLGVALISIYSQIPNKNDRGINLINTVFIFVTFISFLLTITVYFTSNYWVKILAPGFPDTTINIAADILKWLSLLIIGYSIYYIIYSIYNAYFHFTIPVISDIFTGIFVVVSLLFLSNKIGIYAIVIGFVGGVVIVDVILILDLLRRRIINFSFNFKSADFRKLLYFTVPVLIFSLLPQIEVIIENFFASSLKSGSVATLAYAKRLYDIIPTLVGMNLAKAVFPTISFLASEGKVGEIKDIITKLNKQIVVYFIPVTFVFIFFSTDIVRIILMRGKFDMSAVSATAYVFSFYALSLVFNIILPIFFRLYYAFYDTITLFIIGIVVIFIKILANYFITPILGIVGIAIVDTATVFIKISILFIIIRRYLGSIELKGFIKTFLFAILVGGIAIIPFIFLHINFIASAMIYFIFYIFLSYFLLREEIMKVWGYLKKYFSFML